MKKRFWKQFLYVVPIIMVIILSSISFVSCEDEYYYDDKEPEWLGASIYDYLKSTGNYKYFTRLIDDVGYTSVLAKTGSKTLFVADDDAFERFFLDNEWGVTSYDNMSKAQKRLILNYSMINNAYLIETLANYFDGSLQEGTAIRRSTALSMLDSIPFEKGDLLPKGIFWDNYREKGLYILKNASISPMVHFLPKPLNNIGISNSDFKLITGVERNDNDAHIFDNKVIKRDITCKNGYVNVLENVLIPRVNIAEYILKNPNTQIFSGLLERFSAPYFEPSQTDEYNLNHPNNQIDSIFEKRYFSFYNGINEGEVNYPDGNRISNELLLPFDPGMNNYVSQGSSLQSNMAAMLCPTDAAMNAYFETGKGAVLKDRYGSWENIPDDIIILLIKRHLRTSFLETLPYRFDLLTDDENSPIPVTKSDISGSYIGVNGVVYLTDNVYPPDDYVSVYGPVLFSEKSRVFNWAVRQNDFRLYLNSLVSHYSFFVPTDDFFKDYIDPIAFAKDVKAVLKYWYNDEESQVNATVYSYDPSTDVVGDSIGFIDDDVFLRYRLLDLLDSHIVIGDVESGSSYYFTKNGNLLKVQGAGLSLKVQGGNDIERGLVANVIPNGVYQQDNGKTYFIDKPIQTPLQSVYKVLSETPEFSEFFSLLNQFSGKDTTIFIKGTNYYGIDYNIKFFNTFNYTVYVPTNEAVQQAISDSIIKDWDQINAIIDVNIKRDEIKKLERFLRYHFQDNSVFISGESYDKLHQTATIKTDELSTQFGTYKDKYYRLRIQSNGDNMDLSTENYGTAHVVKDNGLYNIMTRDYIFNNNPQAFKEIDGSGSGTDFNLSFITTASTAVIHQIDNVLRFE